jgi:4-carboxymuconolactone decarboxylase
LHRVPVTPLPPTAEKGESALDYIERLRRLAINDTRLAEPDDGGTAVASGELDPKTQTLVRLAALVAVGGAVPSYGALVDDAIGAGATVEEIVGLLVDVIPVAGFPRVVAAAPKLAIALGYDADDVFEQESAG